MNVHNREPIIAKGGLVRLAVVVLTMLVGAALFNWLYALFGGPPLH